MNASEWRLEQEETDMEWLNRQKRRYGERAVLLLLTMAAVCGVDYLGQTAGHFRPYYDITNVFLAVGIYLLLQKTFRLLSGTEDGKQRRRRILYSAFTAFLFAVFMLMGYQLQNYGMTESGFRGKGLLLLHSLLLAVAVFPFAVFFFTGIEKLSSGSKSEPKKTWRSGPLFAVMAALIFLCLVPVWLAYYPIIMSYDFHRQVNEAYNGLAFFYPLQPIAHTWLIRLFLQLGGALGSYQTGMACMAVFHMVLYASVAAYGVVMVYRLTEKKAAAVVTALFLGVFPYHSVLVICTTKDVIFTVLFTLFFLLLLERKLFSTGRKNRILEIVILLEGCLMIQFRNNAIYAVAVFWIVSLIFCQRKEKLRVLLLGALLICGAKGTQSAITAAIGTELHAPSVEAYSVPIMQYARVGYYHGTELLETDPETAAVIGRYVPQELWEKYYAPISDGIKAYISGDVFTENKLQAFRDWLKVARKYPNEFLDAFLELTRGYWFLDDFSWAECLGYGADTEFGAVYTYTSSEIAGYGSIERDSKLPWLQELLHRIVNENCFYDWPVISVLFRISFYVLASFLTALCLLYQRRRDELLTALFPLLYFCTLLPGPVAQIRYVFPLMVTLPVLVALLFSKPFRKT